MCGQSNLTRIGCSFTIEAQVLVFKCYGIGCSGPYREWPVGTLTQAKIVVKGHSHFYGYYFHELGIPSIANVRAFVIANGDRVRWMTWQIRLKWGEMLGSKASQAIRQSWPIFLAPLQEDLPAGPPYAVWKRKLLWLSNHHAVLLMQKPMLLTWYHGRWSRHCIGRWLSIGLARIFESITGCIRAFAGLLAVSRQCRQMLAGFEIKGRYLVQFLSQGQQSLIRTTWLIF